MKTAYTVSIVTEIQMNIRTFKEVARVTERCFHSYLSGEAFNKLLDSRILIHNEIMTMITDADITKEMKKNLVDRLEEARMNPFDN